MADNTQLNAGTGGDVVASDDISGVKHQRVKVEYGADGSATDVSADTGLPVRNQSAELTASFTAAGQTSSTVDVRGMKVAVSQVTGGSGNVSVQFSNDGTNWISSPQTDTGGTSYGSMVPSTTAMFQCLVHGRYARLRCSSYSSGTISVITQFSSGTDNIRSSNGNLVVLGQTPIVLSQPGTSYTGQNAPDGGSGSSTTAIAQYGYRGGSTNTWDRIRIPTVFRTVTATASGNTIVWTPQTSFRFRLMKYQIEVTNEATLASAGALDIKFQDATTDIGVAHSIYVPSVATGGIGSWRSGWIDLGNGYRSSAANNVLNVNLSAALTAGKVRIIACGVDDN